MKKDYSLISFLHRAKRRTAVLKCLEKPKTPKDIAFECKLNISNVSNALTELKEKDLIECINPEDHISKFYQRTKKGDGALGMLKD
jgi:DNA-binding MarR family transcriptional regulator